MNESEDNKMQIIITGGGWLPWARNRPGPCCKAPPFTELLLVDIQQPQPLPDPRVRCLRADLTGTRCRRVPHRRADRRGHHLAAIVSSHAEQDFDLGWKRVNLDTTCTCWRRAAMPGRASASVFTSSPPSRGGRCRSW